MAANTNNQQKIQSQPRPNAQHQPSRRLPSVTEFTLDKMGANLHLGWQKIKQHRVAIGVVAIVLLVVVVIGLMIAVVVLNGTGINGYTVISTTTETTLSPQTKVTTTTQSQPGKTLWDLLQLLAVLAIPVVVGFGAAWFTAHQTEVNDRENKDNQREAALQGYIDKMSELLLEQNLRKSGENEEVRKIGRVRTLTVLRRLDAERKGSVLIFLQESGLIDKDECIIDLKGANLSEANLGLANLSRANLSEVNLSEANLGLANLSRANLSHTNLREAYFTGAHLTGAYLTGAYLTSASFFYANLNHAHLSHAHMRKANLILTDLSFADLSFADLSEASLYKDDLNGADLSGADLKGAIGVTIEELEKQAKSLKGAIMPDGTKHP